MAIRVVVFAVCVSACRPSSVRTTARCLWLTSVRWCSLACACMKFWRATGKTLGMVVGKINFLIFPRVLRAAPFCRGACAVAAHGVASAN